MTSQLSLTAIVPRDKSGFRLDQAAAELFPEYSRACLQGWIKAGELRADGRTLKPNTKLSGGEVLQLDTQLQEEGDWLAEDIPLSIVFEDQDILVIDKAVGMVVHPAAGNWSGTLLNALLHYDPALRHIPRAGIVHRLDKDTSGLMVVARTLEAQNTLVKQLQARSVSRVYQALVHGELADKEGQVDAAIGRHPSARTKMAVVSAGKPAITDYRTLASFSGFSHVELRLHTGRTHQIRVHMAHIGHPLLGDAVYGKTLPRQQLEKQPELQPVANFPRQALHALELGLLHPKTNQACRWHSALPEDFAGLRDYLAETFSSQR